MLYDPQMPKANRRKENHHEEITKKYGSFSTFADRPISINRILYIGIYEIFVFFEGILAGQTREHLFPRAI